MPLVSLKQRIILGGGVGQHSYFYTRFLRHGEELQPIEFQVMDGNFTARKPQSG